MDVSPYLEENPVAETAISRQLYTCRLIFGLLEAKPQFHPIHILASSTCMLSHYTTSWHDLYIRRSVCKTTATLLGCPRITMDFCGLFLGWVSRLGGPQLFRPSTRPVIPFQSTKIIATFFPHTHGIGPRFEDLDRSNFVRFYLGTLSMSVPSERVAG